MTRWIRTSLILTEGFVALTALAGGIAIIVATATAASSGGILPELSYLDGTPFRSYLVPGILLAGVIGGTHAVALALVLRNRRTRLLASVIAAMGLNVWIFVELIFIPFSFLQVIYYAVSLAELGLVTADLGLLRSLARPPVRSQAAETSDAIRR